MMKLLARAFGLMVIVVSLMLLLFPSGRLEASETVHKLVANAWLPLMSPEGQVVDWFYKEVEKVSNGKVKIDAQYASALGGVEETLTLVTKGTLELGFIAPGYVFSSLPLAASSELPFLVPAPDTAMRAALEVYDSFAPFKQEFEQKNKIRMIAPIATDIAVAGFAGPVKKLEDIKGKKIRAYGHYNNVISRWGAVPVATAVGEIYEAIKRGLVFGFEHQPLGTIDRLKFHEVAPYLVEFGSPVHSVCYIIMNLNTWKNLPEDVKEAFQTVAKRAPKATADIYMKIDASVVEKFEKKDVHMYILPPEERERWRALIVPGLWDDWIARIGKPGVPVKDFLAVYTGLVDKFHPMCTYKIPEAFGKGQ